MADLSLAFSAFSTQLRKVGSPPPHARLKKKKRQSKIRQKYHFPVMAIQLGIHMYYVEESVFLDLNVIEWIFPYVTRAKSIPLLVPGCSVVPDAVSAASLVRFCS